MLLKYSQTAVRLQLRLARSLRSCCSSHNTTPPYRLRRGHIPLGGRHIVAGPKNPFWTSTCAGYRSMILVESHTLRCKSWYTCHQRPIHTPCSTLPRLCLGGSCRRQLRQAHCTGAVPTARLLARRTITYHNIGHSYRGWMPSRQRTNRPIHLSILQDILRQSTPLMASRLSNQPLLGIQTVESAITWHPDCRISSPCPT